MSNLQKKIKFQKDSALFYKALKEEVQHLLTPKNLQYAQRFLWLKLLFFSSLFVGAYVHLVLGSNTASWPLLLVNYIFIGWSGILLAFNAAHDAAHQTFGKSKRINALIYHITFNLQGVNARLWKIRHIASHHIFANVDGCDADIDDNPFIRLSPTHPKFWWHQYQHIYASVLYCLYTLHWILIKDFIYLNKRELANLKNISYPLWVGVELLLWKVIYITYMIVIPVYITSFSLGQILLAFVLMHVFISLFFVFTLIISHLFDTTEFPVSDESGYLPHSFYRHQLAVSLDYHPTSWWANWLFGGFNSHSAHHLFPTLPHTLYVELTPFIKKTALRFNYPYHELNIFRAVQSHFRYLKRMGT